MLGKDKDGRSGKLIKLTDFLCFFLSLHMLHWVPLLSLYIYSHLQTRLLLDLSLAFGAPILFQLVSPEISLSCLHLQTTCTSSAKCLERRKRLKWRCIEIPQLTSNYCTIQFVRHHVAVSYRPLPIDYVHNFLNIMQTLVLPAH